MSSFTCIIVRRSEALRRILGVADCHGRTRRQAAQRARRALQFYIDSQRGRGRKPPRQPLVAVEVEVAA